MTAMPKAAQRLATSRPIRPKPMISTRRPRRSTASRLLRTAQLALARRAVVAQALLGERQHEVERVLGDRGGVRVGRDRERDAAPGERVDVDVVVADAVARDHLQAQRRARSRRPAASEVRMVTPSASAIFSASSSSAPSTISQRHVRARLEQPHAVFVKRLHHQHLGHRHRLPRAFPIQSTADVRPRVRSVMFTRPRQPSGCPDQVRARQADVLRAAPAHRTRMMPQRARRQKA